MLSTTRERYQHGSLRRLPRAKGGFAWEFRYYEFNQKGKRIRKHINLDGSVYKTEKAVRQHLESFLIKLNKTTEYAQASAVTFGALLDRYEEEEMPARHSTRGGYTSIINRHIRPRWGSRIISEIRPADLHSWFQQLELAPVTKGHVRSLMHKLFDLATLWEYVSADRRNPVEIVKVKDVTRRTKETVVLSPEQFREVVKRLPETVNMIAVTTACLGLRVSEALGLKWHDFDWKHQTVTINRSAYRGSIDETKTSASKSKLPIHPTLAKLLLAWKDKCEERDLTLSPEVEQKPSEWVFANPNTGMPYHSPSLQQRWIRPAGEAIGIEGLGFHSLRHSYRSWLDAAGIAPGVTKDLMRHSAISTTFNVYGKALSPEKREANSKVIEMLLPEGTIE